jgi:hypothetical protein
VRQVWRYAAAISSINLSDNVLAALPDRLAALPALRDLLLERNRLTHLPPGLYRLTGLHRLALAENLLYDPPQARLPASHSLPGTRTLPASGLLGIPIRLPGTLALLRCDSRESWSPVAPRDPRTSLLAASRRRGAASPSE